jgi:hypothetical protein
VLVLLIIFMVTARLIVSRAIPGVDTPRRRRARSAHDAGADHRRAAGAVRERRSAPTEVAAGEMLKKAVARTPTCRR